MKRFGIEDFALALALVSFGVACFALGISIKEDKLTEEPREVVEDQEEFYSPEIPLTEEEQADLYEASEEFEVDYCTMLGLIEKETNFRNISGDGGKASGYCQIWKVYWSDLMTDIGAEDLTVPKDNFRTACAIVSELTDRYGSVAGALTAYNLGSYDGKVSKYAVSVLENAEKWREIEKRPL